MSDYPNTPPELLEEIRAAVEPLPGWTSVARCREMADAIFETRPRLAVELGVFGGRSLVAQALAMRHLNLLHGHGGTVVGIDPWRREDAQENENEANRQWWGTVDLDRIHRTAMQALWSRDLHPHCVVMRSASQHAAVIFGGVNMLFIDANHSEEASLRDVETWVPKVTAGGYIFADDADWPSTARAYARLREMADVVAIGDEVLPDGTHKKGHYLVLRKKP